MTSSIESVERLERAHGLVKSLSVEVFPGSATDRAKDWRLARGSRKRNGFEGQ